MDMITIRRKLMAMQNQPVPSDYITNGLVLWMDGIDKGSIANAWTDLVRGHVFTANGDVTFNSDHITLANSGFLSNSSFTTPSSSVGTIEVVYNGSITGGYIVYMPKGQSELAFGRYQNYIVYTDRPYMLNSIAQTNNFGSVSGSNQLIMLNGTPSTVNHYDGWLNNDNQNNYIGKRGLGSSFEFTGDIYCIRIYNRQLTQAEVLANYATDQSRFSFFN